MPLVSSGQSQYFFGGKKYVTTAQDFPERRLGLFHDTNDDLSIFVEEFHLRMRIDLILTPQFLRDGHLAFGRYFQSITPSVILLPIILRIKEGLEA
jgi:hypothetical protein